MDMEFVIQDTFALLRPQLKIASTLEEASRAFAEACKQNYQNKAASKAEPEEVEELDASDDGRDDEDMKVDNVEGEASSDEDATVRARSSNHTSSCSD